MHTYAVVLAAGQGTRMKSKLYKVLHPVCGKPMVQHVIDQVEQLAPTKIVTVVGHGAEAVKSILLNKSDFSLQSEQLGTAHAVLQASDHLSHLEGTTIVLCGDTPLITSETMDKLLTHHHTTNAKATILTAIAQDPTGYGRIVRGENGRVEKIVEHKDATDQEKQLKEINTGTYCFDNQLLFSCLSKVSNHNVQGEYYLPDVIEILVKDQFIVSAYQTNDFSETLGVNDRIALATAEATMNKRILMKHMINGVTIQDTFSTYIGTDVIIGKDTTILPGSIITGQTIIGSGCRIGPQSEIVDSVIGDNVVVKHSVCLESKIGNETQIGPFAHIRPESKLGNQVRIGNFVEVKKTLMGDESKASHLSYLGDSKIGSNVNIGCGSITVNYDGKNKFETIIEDGVFVGCNSNLIAPVTIGEGSLIAAGSTITKSVPKNSLSIARTPQVDKPDYMKR